MDENYEQLLNEGARVRDEIDTIYRPQYDAVKKLFADVFEANGFTGKDIKHLADLIYYTGGYPSENSPPRVEVFGDLVASALKLGEHSGHDVLKRYLASKGVQVTFSTIALRDVSITPERKTLLESCAVSYPPEKTTVSTRDLLQDLIERTQKLQSEICSLADEVKIELAEKAEKEHEIKKGNFVRAVKIKAISLSKDRDKMMEALEKIQDNIHNMETALEPLSKR